MGSIWQPFPFGLGPYATTSDLSGAVLANPAPIEGTLAYVLATDAYYQLSLTSGATLGADALATTLGGDSRWLRMNVETREASVQLVHTAIVTPSTFKAPGLKEPTLIEANAALLLAFTLNNDAAFRQFKISPYYVGDAAFHLHWTKSTDANEAGKRARWRISYVVFNGNSQDVNVAPSTVEFEGEYASSGTTSRIVYRSSNLVIPEAAASYYVAMMVEAITPTGGAAMAGEPALFSVDVTYNEQI